MLVSRSAQSGAPMDASIASSVSQDWKTKMRSRSQLYNDKKIHVPKRSASHPCLRLLTCSAFTVKARLAASLPDMLLAVTCKRAELRTCL